MKNISRRVFIKGMAVAAVATAASTVLAGCNVPGTVTETPVAGFQPVTKTLTFGDKKTVEMTANSLSTTMDEIVKIGFKFSNKTDKNLYFAYNTVNIDSATTKQINVKVDVYADDKYEASTIEAGKDSIYYGKNSTDPYKSNTDKDTGVSTTYAHEGYLYVKPNKDDWSKLTIVMTYEDNAGKAQEVRFVINK